MTLLLGKLSTVNMILVIALVAIAAVMIIIIFAKAHKVKKEHYSNNPNPSRSANPVPDPDVADLLKGVEEYHRYGANVTLRDENRPYVLDHLYVSQNGVFVIAEKDFYGKVVGQEGFPSWSEQIGGVTRVINNPVIELDPIIRIISNLIGDRAPIHKMVVVHGDILGIDGQHVCNSDHLRTFLYQPLAEPLSHEEVDEIYEKIKLAK